MNIIYRIIGAALIGIWVISMLYGLSHHAMD